MLPLNLDVLDLGWEATGGWLFFVLFLLDKITRFKMSLGLPTTWLQYDPFHLQIAGIFMHIIDLMYRLK